MRHAVYTEGTIAGDCAKLMSNCGQLAQLGARAAACMTGMLTLTAGVSGLLLSLQAPDRKHLA